MYHEPKGIITSLKKGIISSVSAGIVADVYKNIAAPAPTTDCQKYLYLLARPFGS